MARTIIPMFTVVRSVPGVWPLLRELRRSLRDCQSVLDVGCGNASPLRTLRVAHLVGLEGFEPACQEAQAKATHDEVVAASKLVPDDVVQRCTASGTPDEAKAKVGEYIANGCTTPILYPLGPDVRLMIDTFAT